MRVLLCFDDTDCSQMSLQHIHSVGGDKDVLQEDRVRQDRRIKYIKKKEGNGMHRAVKVKIKR